MQAAQIGTQVKTELCSRLRIGGQWFMAGQTVQLDKSDVEIYEARGISRPARPGSKAANVKEVIPASQVGLVSKDTAETENVESTEKTVNTEVLHVRKSRKGA